MNAKPSELPAGMARFNDVSIPPEFCGGIFYRFTTTDEFGYADESASSLMYTALPVIDTTPQEAIISYDPGVNDIIVKGMDDKYDDVDIELVNAKKNKRIYLLKDDAGNELRVVMKYKKNVYVRIRENHQHAIQ